jgi:hypothetical protein
MGGGLDVGGGFYGGGSTQVLNSIIWDNGNPSTHAQTLEENQIKVYPGTSFEIDYSVVQYWSGMYGGPGNTGNSGIDPMLADLDGKDDIPGNEDDDGHLLPGSPLINGGFESPYALPTDLDGHARVLCGQVDIGAYEFGIGDFDCDQAVNLTDFSAWQQCMTDPTDPPLSPLGKGGGSAESAPAPADFQLGIGGGAGCEAFDFNADSDIDLADFAYLQRVFVAP